MDEVPGSRAAVPRGGARDALIQAATELLAGATLDDLTAFVTVSRLKEVSGLSSGAIYSAFQPTSGIGGRTRSAPQSVAREAILRPADGGDLLTGAASGVIDDIVSRAESETDRLLVDALADLVAVPIVEGARGSLAAQYTQLWIQVAVSLNDPEVAADLLEAFHGYDAVYSALVSRLLDLTDRAPIEGVDVDRLATMMMTAVDGAALRVRFDPSLDERFVSQFIVALWVGLTRRSDAPDDMIGHRIAVQTTAPLEVEEQDAVMAAVRRVSERAGWAAVTLRKVAQLSGVPDARLAARYPTRDHLAPLWWDGTVATIERRAASRTSLDERARVDGIVRDLTDAACSDRALVSSLLTLRLRSADDLERGSGADPTRRVDALLNGVLDDVVVGLTIDAVLMRAATSNVRADDLADAVLAGFLGHPYDRR